MKYKAHTEVLHEVRHTIRGDEPFLRFVRPRMIVNISACWSGSHNFFEGEVDEFSTLKPGDVFAFQLVKLSQVPLTGWERVWSWVRGLK